MRRGRFKNIRIWTKLDLGNGYREDLFMTSADNQPIEFQPIRFQVMDELAIKDWKENIE